MYSGFHKLAIRSENYLPQTKNSFFEISKMGPTKISLAARAATVCARGFCNPPPAWFEGSRMPVRRRYVRAMLTVGTRHQAGAAIARTGRSRRPRVVRIARPQLEGGGTAAGGDRWCVLRDGVG